MTIQRRFKHFKYLLKAQGKIEEEIENIQEQINKLDWTEEGRNQKIRLYLQLGKIMEFYRTERVTIRWYNIQLLENANLTG